MTPAERMRKYRARKHLRAAWERAIRAGVDPCELMGVTRIGVTARSGDPLAGSIDSVLMRMQAEEAAMRAARQS